MAIGLRTEWSNWKISTARSSPRARRGMCEPDERAVAAVVGFRRRRDAGAGFPLPPLPRRAFKTSIPFGIQDTVSEIPDKVKLGEREMKTRLAVAMSIVAAVAMVAGAASAQDRLETIKARGKLLVGTGSTNPPWH